MVNLSILIPIVFNTGHYDVEINLVQLKKMAKSIKEIRNNVEEYLLKDGRRIFVLAKGRLVNLVAAEGHPSEVMDMSFANQFMAQLRLVELFKKGKKLEPKVYEIPPEQDEEIAELKLKTKETAVLIKTFVECGAEVSWSGCNPLSTQDTIAAALAKQGISIFAWNGMSVDEFYWAIEQTLHIKPNLTLDDGADLIFTIHSKHPELIPDIIGGTEETTTGVKRLRAMAEAGALKYPIIAVNDAETKWDFDNVYGTGQSTLDGILRATSILIAGKNVVVAGYGHCGKGVAMRARGLGANVIVTEVRPIAALKAVLDGFTVMPMKEAAKVGDIFITATGVKDVITEEHFKVMKDGAIVCNTGHYDDFTEKAHRDYYNLPDTVIKNRKILEDVMKKYGFIPLPTEWWHFDAQGWENFSILDIPLKELNKK